MKKTHNLDKLNKTLNIPHKPQQRRRPRPFLPSRMINCRKVCTLSSRMMVMKDEGYFLQIFTPFYLTHHWLSQIGYTPETGFVSKLVRCRNKTQRSSTMLWINLTWIYAKLSTRFFPSLKCVPAFMTDHPGRYLQVPEIVIVEGKKKTPFMPLQLLCTSDVQAGEPRSSINIKYLCKWVPPEHDISSRSAGSNLGTFCVRSLVDHQARNHEGFE